MVMWLASRRTGSQVVGADDLVAGHKNTQAVGLIERPKQINDTQMQLRSAGRAARPTGTCRPAAQLARPAQLPDPSPRLNSLELDEVELMMRDLNSDPDLGPDLI